MLVISHFGDSASLEQERQVISKIESKYFKVIFMISVYVTISIAANVSPSKTSTPERKQTDRVILPPNILK